MKKLLSILLCLALLCCLASVTALAAFVPEEPGPNDPSDGWFDNTVIPSDKGITLTIPIVKIVRLGGAIAPGRRALQPIITKTICLR